MPGEDRFCAERSMSGWTLCERHRRELIVPDSLLIPQMYLADPQFFRPHVPLDSDDESAPKRMRRVPSTE